MSFAFLTVAALLYWAIRPAFGTTPQYIFYVSSLLMALGAAFFLWRLKGTGIMIGNRPTEDVDAESEETGNPDEPPNNTDRA